MNKYAKWYNTIISNRKIYEVSCDIYSEKHHIIPRSLGGNDNIENLVKLTSREHFICHYLLTKIYKIGSCEWYKMQLAFNFMNATSRTQTSRYMNSRLYASNRENFAKTMSVLQSGTRNSQSGKIWITNYNLKKSQSVRIEDLYCWESIGWIRGRKLNFNLVNIKKEKIQKKKEIKVNKRELHQKLAIDLYDKYRKSDSISLRDFVRKGNYNHSHVSLTRLFKLHIPEYAQLAKQGRNYSHNNGGPGETRTHVDGD